MVCRVLPGVLQLVPPYLQQRGERAAAAAGVSGQQRSLSLPATAGLVASEQPGSERQASDTNCPAQPDILTSWRSVCVGMSPGIPGNSSSSIICSRQAGVCLLHLASGLAAGGSKRRRQAAGPAAAALGRCGAMHVAPGYRLYAGSPGTAAVGLLAAPSALFSPHHRALLGAAGQRLHAHPCHPCRTARHGQTCRADATRRTAN